MNKLSDKSLAKSSPTKISYFMNTKNWRLPLTVILAISLIGVGLIGFQTYVDAPPITTFKDNNGNTVFDKSTIERGQEVFHKYALMEYGSFFCDGAQRGSDFTTEALHKMNGYMLEYYEGRGFNSVAKPKGNGW